MSNKSDFEWRNVNSQIDFPFVDTKNLPTDFIVDATLNLKPPVILTSVEKLGTFLRININNGIYWQFDTANPTEYIFNDFGKLVIQNTEYFSNFVEGQSENFNLEFLQPLCIDSKNLSLQGLIDDLTLVADIIPDGNTLQLQLETTEQFCFDCIETINGVRSSSDNFLITGDSCTSVVGYVGQVALDDVCLPPCYDCNDRLTTGDVTLYRLSLEARVAALENP